MARKETGNVAGEPVTTPTPSRSAESTKQAKATRLGRLAIARKLVPNTQTNGDKVTLFLRDGSEVDLALLGGPTIVNMVNAEKNKPSAVDQIAEQAKTMTEQEKYELGVKLGFLVETPPAGEPVDSETAYTAAAPEDTEE